MIFQVVKKIECITSKSRSYLYDYSDACIVVKGTVTIEGDNYARKINKKLSFKNSGPFRSCISKTNITFVDNDTVIPIYNLLEYSYNYSLASASLWNYYSNEVNDDQKKNNAVNNRINNNKTITSNSFKYEIKLIRSTPSNNNILDAEVVVLLKLLSNFWRSLDLPLTYCETEVAFSWSKKCIVSEISITSAVG